MRYEDVMPQLCSMSKKINQKISGVLLRTVRFFREFNKAKTMTKGIGERYTFGTSPFNALTFPDCPCVNCLFRGLDNIVYHKIHVYRRPMSGVSTSLLDGLCRNGSRDVG